MSNDLIIDVASWALKVERLRANVAAENIATANISGKTQRIDFDALINEMSSVVRSGDSRAFDALTKRDIKIETESNKSLFNSVALDNEVAELSAAKGRYKIISEALSRQFGLMSLATKGR